MNQGSEAASRPPGLAALLADRRMAVMLALGFASGLPNFLAFDTLSAWLRSDGVSLSVISLFSLATLPYSFKFLWAPLVDRLRPPFSGRLGARRTWMIIAQAGVLLGLGGMSAGDPVRGMGWLALCAALTGFAGATQDIVIDAWRIESAPGERQGALAAAYQWGYRIAAILAGAAPLFLAARIGWGGAYGLMTLAMGAGVVAALLAPRGGEPSFRALGVEGMKARPVAETLEWAARGAMIVLAGVLLASGLGAKVDLLAAGLNIIGLSDTATGLSRLWGQPAVGVWLQLAAVLGGFLVVALAATPLPGLGSRPGLIIFHALGDPIVDVFRRFGRRAVVILALICLYRLSDFVLNIMNAFYLDVGFSLPEIAEARKVFGVFAALAGVALGGAVIARWGLNRALIAGAFALPVANASFAVLAVLGPNFPALLAVIGVDNIVSSFAGTCLIAYMSGLTGAGFTATQYALFSSLYALPGKIIASQSGRIVETAARAADAGGPVAQLKVLFVHTPARAFAGAMVRSHVSPAALGAGYVSFFLYAGAVGLFAIVLAVVATREPELRSD